MELSTPADTPADTLGIPDAAPDRDIESVAALGEPLRRALYRHVTAQPSPVSRDQAATALGIARHTAKFHLDRLVTDGLLDVEFARPPGRNGPGAGRPAKLFRRAARDVAVSLPARHYDLAGLLLARAIRDAEIEHMPVRDALAHAAKEHGRALAADVRRAVGSVGSVGSVGDAPASDATLCSLLTSCGYEPRTTADGIVLVNCPFHALATEHTELICGMNLALLDGVVHALGLTAVAAILDPAPSRCCVRLRATQPASS